MRPGDRAEVKPGMRYQLHNPLDEPWQVNQIHEPQWEPDDTFYISLEGSIIPGDQVGLEVAILD
jgi:hypothetical protein